MNRDDFLKQANRYWEEKNYDSSKKFFEKALNILIDQDTLLDYALMLSEYNTAESMNVYNKMIDFYPNFASGYYGLATIYDDELSYDKAIFYYEEALLRDDKYDSCYFNLANIYEELKDFGKAKYYYEMTLNVNKDHFWANTNIGHLYEQENKDDIALKYFTNALNISKTSTSYFNIGVIYKKKKAYDKAIFYYKLALDFSKPYEYAFLNIAVIYKDIYGDLNKALTYYDKGLECYPNSSILLYNRACIYALKKDKRAIIDLNKAISINPELRDYAKRDLELKDIITKQN